MRRRWPIRKEVDKMHKATRVPKKELDFVRKYCFGGTFPASDERCPYAKIKLRTSVPKSPTDDSGFEGVDAMFLCRYSDKRIPLHEAHLISELSQCPSAERRRHIDALDVSQI